MKGEDIRKHVEKIERMVEGEALAPEIAKTDFQRLVAIILSARTREEKTIEACNLLFSRFPDEHAMERARPEDLERLIKTVGFYRQKAKAIREVARIVAREGIRAEREWLESLPGVGRKTANVFLQLSGIPAIAVDTHVHRIANRLGWVETGTSEETEKELMESLPRDLWNKINPLLVRFGRQICRPRNPDCERCLLREECGFYMSRPGSNHAKTN